MQVRLPTFLRAAASLTLCRGCLGPVGAAAEAGLCARCWEGLLPLPEFRCPRCALSHEPEQPCPEPVAWRYGDACWDYHGGRPPFGALLVPGIKEGEQGWKRALLGRVEREPLPPWTADVDLVTCAPTGPWRRFWRGFDLAEEVARSFAQRLQRPFMLTLEKPLWAKRQSGRTETQRRRLPRKALRLRASASVEGRIVLLVDDVWTTGTTLLRCAQALESGGAKEVRVFTLFRALKAVPTE